VIEKSKEGYSLALRQTQSTIRTDSPNWQPWIMYVLKSLDEQKQILENKITRERIILGDLPILSVKILEITREHGRITVSNIVKTTDTNRHTVKDQIKSLHRNGFLEKHGAGRGTWYSLA